jgi:hypothetical protein
MLKYNPLNDAEKEKKYAEASKATTGAKTKPRLFADDYTFDSSDYPTIGRPPEKTASLSLHLRTGYTGDAEKPFTGASINTTMGKVKNYDEAQEDDPGALIGVKRPEVFSIGATPEGRAYIPSMLAKIREHSIRELGVLPTHASNLSSHSDRIVKRAIQSGWAAQNPQPSGSNIYGPAQGRTTVNKNISLSNKFRKPMSAEDTEAYLKEGRESYRDLLRASKPENPVSRPSHSQQFEQLSLFPTADVSSLRNTLGNR